MDWELAEQIRFMWNADNEYKCDRCPENKGKKDSLYPCGNNICWVTINCEKNERY